MAQSASPVSAVCLRVSKRRAIVFLGGNGEWNAKVAFDGLEKEKERLLRSRFDYWIDGETNNRWFHGWPNNADHKHCFCFKWKTGNVHQRLYGFLCWPLPHDPSFQACVLIYHTTKTTDDTDFSVLGRVNLLRTATAVTAVRLAIQESMK